MSTLTPTATTHTLASSVDQRRSLPAFFGLIVVLSAPFFVLNAVTGWELFPSIPISALTVFAPLLAASVLLHRAHGRAGVADLLKRSLDDRRIRPLIWYVPILLIMPAVSVVMYVLMRWQGKPAPAPEFSLLTTLFLAVVLFVMALGEEAGWMGYAIHPMQDRWGALGAAVLLGLFWAAWHLIPLLQVGRALNWVGWWTLFTVASRVLIVWLSNSTGGSILAAVLFHTMLNLGYGLYPVAGSHYDYRIAGLLVTLIALVVTVIWGPRTLAGSGNDG